MARLRCPFAASASYLRHREATQRPFAAAHLFLRQVGRHYKCEEIAV